MEGPSAQLAAVSPYQSGGTIGSVLVEITVLLIKGTLVSFGDVRWFFGIRSCSGLGGMWLQCQGSCMSQTWRQWFESSSLFGKRSQDILRQDRKTENVIAVGPTGEQSAIQSAEH